MLKGPLAIEVQGNFQHYPGFWTGLFLQGAPRYRCSESSNNPLSHFVHQIASLVSVFFQEFFSFHLLFFFFTKINIHNSNGDKLNKKILPKLHEEVFLNSTLKFGQYHQFVKLHEPKSMKGCEAIFVRNKIFLYFFLRKFSKIQTWFISFCRCFFASGNSLANAKIGKAVSIANIADAKNPNHHAPTHRGSDESFRVILHKILFILFEFVD